MSLNEDKNIDAIETVVAVLRSGNSVELSAEGYSMFPTFLPGDRIIVRPLAWGELPVAGSVVVYKDNGGLILHRLLKIIESDTGQLIYITRGDSMSEPDSPCQFHQFLGVAVSYKRSERGLPVKPFTPASWRYIINRRLLWLNSISKRIFF
jgi:signal peptidase I